MNPLPRKNKDGAITSYQLRVYIGRNDEGKQVLARKTWKPEKAYTEKQLEKELARQQLLFENEIAESGITANGFFDLNPKVTFKVFAEKWMEEVCSKNSKVRTVETYKGKLKRIYPAIGHIPLEKLTPDKLNSFLNNLREPGVKITGKEKSGLSNKTIKDYYTLISNILSTAVKWKVLKENPMKLIDVPKVKHKQVKSLSKKEVLELFKLLDQEAPLKFNVFIKLAVLSGMRRGEILGLKWSAIDFDNHVIRIRETLSYSPDTGIFTDTPKTESSVRTIKLSNIVFELLQRQKEEQEKQKQKVGSQWIDSKYVFTKWNGAPMSPNTPYDWFDKFQKAHVLEHHSIHALRHTTATLLIMDGANEKLVSGRLGHSNTSTTTNIYAEYIQEADALASEALDDILGLK